MKIENFKMKVTPEQSKRVQEVCFANGATWTSGLKAVSYLGWGWLFCEGDELSGGYHSDGEQPELTFPEFIAKYAPEKQPAPPQLNPIHIATAFRIFGPSTDVDSITKIVNIVLDNVELFERLERLGNDFNR